MSQANASPLDLTLSILPLWAGPKPIRLRIMDVIAKRLARVTHANGFYTDIGTQCTYGQMYGGLPDVMPSVNVWDQDENESGRRYGAIEQNEMLVVVEAYTLMVDDQPIVPIYHNWLLADIKSAIWTDVDLLEPDPTFGGLADGLKYISSEMCYGTNERMYTGAIVQFAVRYQCLAYDPSRLREES